MFSTPFVVGIDANRIVKDELTEALRVQRARRRIAVTDLVNPRQAYFRRVHPEIVPSETRLQLMLSGTGFHELFGHVVSSEEFIEQFLEFEDIVGKVDIYEDVPTELKTTGSMPEDVSVSRPSYIDQLGMYCTMAKRPRGRLVICKRSAWGQVPEMKCFRLEFLDLDAIAEEMRRRRDLLRDAMDRNDPSALPLCEWFTFECDYVAVCGCETASLGRRVVASSQYEFGEDGEATAELIEKLKAGRPIVAKGFGLNDLVFPRRAAFERLREEDETPEESLEERLVGLQRRGLADALYSALRYGTPGSFRGIPVALRELRGIVRTYRGSPTLLRTVRSAVMIAREYLPERFPHYFERLAFECALVGAQNGRLVIYYENIPNDKFMVYDVSFRDLEEIVAEADRRLRLLESGVALVELPPCPAWMAPRCRFAPGCGCG